MTLADYFTANPTATAADYNALPPVWRRVPTAEVRDLLTTRRLNAPLRFARDNPVVPELLRGGIVEFLATLNGFDVLDATDERNRTDAQQVVGGLVQAGVIQQADADAFLALLAEPREVATDESVATIKAKIARSADATAIRARVLAYLNDVLNPAEADPALPLVTPEQQFGSAA